MTQRSSRAFRALLHSPAVPTGSASPSLPSKHPRTEVTSLQEWNSPPAPCSSRVTHSNSGTPQSPPASTPQLLSHRQDTQITIVCAARIPQHYSGFYTTAGMGHSTALGLSLAPRICGFKFFYLIVMSHLGSFFLFLELLPGSLS